MLHSANWDRDVSLEGKTIAVIGSGSSGVQIVPSIRPCKLWLTFNTTVHIINVRAVAKQLKCFIRSASWVTAGFGSSFAGRDGGNFKCRFQEAQRDGSLY